MPTLPEDEKKKKINTSPYMMTGGQPSASQARGLHPVVQDVASRIYNASSHSGPSRPFTDTAGTEAYDPAAIASQQQPRAVSTTGQAVAAQMAGAPYKQPEQDVAPVGGLPKPAAAPATTPSAPAAPDATGNPGNYGALVGNATRGLFSPEGSISFDPKTKTYSGTNVGADAQITGGRNSGAGVSVVPGYFSGGEDSAAARDARYTQTLRDIQGLRTAEMDKGMPSPGVTVMDTRASVTKPDNRMSDVMGMLKSGKIGLRGANMLLDHQTAGDNRAANMLTEDRRMANQTAIAKEQNATRLQELAANERDDQTRRGLDSRRLALDEQKAVQDAQTFGLGLESERQTQALRKTMLDPNATPEQRSAASANLSVLAGKGLPQSEWVAGSYKDEMGAETPFALDKTTGNTKDIKRQSAPYQDGQELIGPDGKKYIMRNGKPVLKG